MKQFRFMPEKLYTPEDVEEIVEVVKDYAFFTGQLRELERKPFASAYSQDTNEARKFYLEKLKPLMGKMEKYKEFFEEEILYLAGLNL